jgi:hypothetical protein
LVGGVAIGVGGFLVYKLVRKLITGMQKRNTEKQASDSPEIRQAMMLRSAMNPSGISWMKSFDTTNTAALFDTAKQVKSLDNVIASYRKLYDDDMLKDLQNELSTSDYQKFLTMVSSNPDKKGGSAPVKFAEKLQMVVARAEVFLRSSPDASSHGAIYEINNKNNIIRKAKVGEFLGYATGNQSFDTKNNVKFIEVAYLVIKEGLPASLKSSAGKTFSLWVSSSSNYVEIFAFYKQMWEKYPKTQLEVRYKKPLNYFTGMKGLPQKPVVTIRLTQVLDEQFKRPLKVPSQTLLGEYLETFDTGRTKYVKFRTVDNTLRWVVEADITIKD